ncbi:hypothetical protein HY414_00450, partial [Candidatus Kaiserbacteria bacterium]|nr:hypothetical protein [Candidatus Kaiserbacteria bacterium]
HMVRVGVHDKLVPPLIEKVEKTLKKIFKFDNRGKKIFEDEVEDEDDDDSEDDDDEADDSDDDEDEDDD